MGCAYFDNDTADYHISTGTERTVWNRGRTYRNDGVDIARDTASGEIYVSNMETGEWLHYTFTVAGDGTYSLSVAVSGEGEVTASVNSTLFTKGFSFPKNREGQNWQNVTLQSVPLQKGKNSLRIQATKGGFDLKGIQFQLQ